VVLGSTKLQERPSPFDPALRGTQDGGAEGASSGEIGVKLSGKRTAALLNPGEIQAVGLDTEGDKS